MSNKAVSLGLMLNGAGRHMNSWKHLSGPADASEGFFGRLKTELFYPRDWKTTTIEQFIKEVDNYIRWYNEKRIKMSLGARSPIEYRNSLGIVT